MPLVDLFAGLHEVAAADGMPTAYVEAAQLEDAARALRGAGFTVLLDAVPVDLHPRDPRFEISYLLLNPGDAGTAPARLRLKVRVYQYHCEHCGRMWTPPSLLLTPGGGARASARFVQQAAAFIRRADIAGAAAFFGVPETTLARWYYGHAQHDEELSEAEGAGEPIRSLGIDELSLKKSTGSSSP